MAILSAKILHAASGGVWGGVALPTDEAAGPKHHIMHNAEIVPMSAARMRAANRAAVERELAVAQQAQWEEQ